MAPIWDLMSSPIMGIPAFLNFSAQIGSEAMKTGRQLIIATPVFRQTSAQYSTAFWLPTGR